MLATIIVIIAVGYMLWRLKAFEKKLNGAPANDQVVMGVLTAIQELQNKGGSDEEWEQLLRPQRAKLRAALRDRMSTDYGIKESDFKLEILEETLTKDLNQADATGREEAVPWSG